jgi:hypothetical protein
MDQTHNTQVVQLTQKNWIKKVEKAISNGGACILSVTFVLLDSLTHQQIKH